MLGTPVKEGTVLFEVTPLNSYRAILEVDEEDISYVTSGSLGALTLTGAPGRSLPFRVERITSVSTPEDGRNFFRVEASLLDTHASLRPGMEGIAKIDIDERPLLWIWTRSIFERLRLWAWQWLP